MAELGFVPLENGIPNGQHRREGEAIPLCGKKLSLNDLALRFWSGGVYFPDLLRVLLLLVNLAAEIIALLWSRNDPADSPLFNIAFSVENIKLWSVDVFPHFIKNAQRLRQYIVPCDNLQTSLSRASAPCNLAEIMREHQAIHFHATMFLRKPAKPTETR